MKFKGGLNERDDEIIEIAADKNSKLYVEKYAYCLEQVLKHSTTKVFQEYPDICSRQKFISAIFINEMFALELGGFLSLRLKVDNDIQKVYTEVFDGVDKGVYKTDLDLFQFMLTLMGRAMVKTPAGFRIVSGPAMTPEDFLKVTPTVSENLESKGEKRDHKFGSPVHTGGAGAAAIPPVSLNLTAVETPEGDVQATSVSQARPG